MIGRRLGNLLIAAGLILMVWPAATWVYGLYWQERLARSFPSAPVTTGAPVDV